MSFFKILIYQKIAMWLLLPYFFSTFSVWWLFSIHVFFYFPFAWRAILKEKLLEYERHWDWEDGGSPLHRENLPKHTARATMKWFSSKNINAWMVQSFSTPKSNQESEVRKQLRFIDSVWPSYSIAVKGGKDQLRESEYIRISHSWHSSHLFTKHCQNRELFSFSFIVIHFFVWKYHTLCK